MQRPLRVPAFAFALAAICVGVAVFGGWWWGRSTAPTIATTSATAARGLTANEPRHVAPSAGARFERKESPELDEITLASGALDIRNSDASATKRFVVRVGDAVVEPKASAFRIVAKDGAIESVVVEEGSVDLRVAGFFAEIPAGGSWHASTVAVATSPSNAASSNAASSTAASSNAGPSTATPSTAVAAVDPTAKSAPSATNLASNDTPPPSQVSPPSRSTPSVAVANNDPPSRPHADTHGNEPSPTATAPKGPSFSTGMRSLDQGDYDTAAAQMEAFSKAHPADARSDEADYMRAIALERGGHRDEAKAAAQHYLSTWPNGSHRAEAAAIAAN